MKSGKTINSLNKGGIALISLSLGTAALTIMPPSAEAGAIRPGAISGTPSVLPRNDDGSTGLVPIGFNIDFFGVTSSNLYVNNNGNVTFTGSLGTFTPFGLNNVATQIIAPFFADVDTRNLASAEVTYGQGTVDGRNAFTVNWDSQGVGYYNTQADKLNKFQLVITDRSDIGNGDFDFEFNYDQIQWETGSASGGSGGLGGTSAAAGYSNGLGGSGNVSYELLGSLVNGAFLDGSPNALISNSLNSDVLGRYAFSVRNGQVIVDPPTSTPEASTSLGLIALASFGLTSIYKKKKIQA
jgi:Nidogen-like